MYDLVHRARSKHHPRLWAFDFFHIGTRDIFQSGFALKIGLSRKVFSSHANDPFFVSQLAIRACSWFRFQIWHSYPKWTFVTVVKNHLHFFVPHTQIDKWVDDFFFKNASPSKIWVHNQKPIFTWFHFRFQNQELDNTAPPSQKGA